MSGAIFTENKSVNGTNVYYEYYQHSSAKDTMVLLHGFLSSTFSFRRLIPLLMQDYNVISIDLPPFGKSGKTRRFIYSYQNMANTVIQLLESLGIRQVYLIGHSMGGQISLHIMYQRPELVHKAVLLCSSAYLARSKPPLIFLSHLPFFHLHVKHRLEKSGLKHNLHNVVYNHSLIDEEMMNGYLQPFLDNGIFPALTRMIHDREGDLPADILRQIDIPCLLIWGEHDKVVHVSVGQRLKKDLKNSQLIVLKDTGHLVPEERPEDVYTHIKKFIK